MSLKSYGTIFQYGDTADYSTATTWTTVATIKKIKPPKKKAKDIDVTHLASANEFEDFIAGQASGGEVELDLQYAGAAEITLDGFFGTVKSWRIVYTDLSGWKLNGYICEEGDEEISNGEILMSGIKIKVTNKPVRAAVGALT